MISTNDFIDLTQPDPDERASQAMKYGVVTAVSAGRPEIRFDGETTPSQKRYMKLASYAPAVSDRVALMPTAGTYLILGKVD